MTMVKKKLIAGFVIGALAFLCGCSDGQLPPTNSQTTDSATVTESPAIKKDIWAVRSGRAQFVICYEDANYKSTAEDLASLLKAKTKTEFSVIRGTRLLNGRSAIFVGEVVDDSLKSVYREKGISYSGYGAVYANGNVYLCGYTAETVDRAMRKFMSGLVAEDTAKGEDGKPQTFFSESMFFLYQPIYEVVDAFLLGAPLSAYRLVIPSDAGSTLQEAVRIFQTSVGEKTGVVLPIVNDRTEATAHEIVIGFAKSRSVSATLRDSYGLLDYQLAGADGSIAVGYGGKIALIAAGTDLLNRISAKSADTVSVTANAKETLLRNSAVERSDETDYRFMSYNLLGVQETGTHCSLQMRTDLAAEYILAFAPDSVGVQELNGGNRSCMEKTGLLDTYTLVSFAGFGSPWVSTLYKTAKYDLLESNCISIQVHDSQNYFMTWVALKDKATGQVVIHANLHLDYSSAKNRLEQAVLVNAELKRAMAKYPGAMLGMSGDYNTTADVTDLFLALENGTGLRDAQELLPDDRNDADRNSCPGVCTPGALLLGSPIDHILINTDTTEALLHDVIQDDLVCHASDHYPVIVDVRKA